MAVPTPTATSIKNARNSARVVRWAIYAMVWVATTVPMAMKWQLPIIPSPPSERMFEAIDALDPEDGLVILGIDWDAGTLGETGPQTEGVVEHLFQKGVRFAVFGWAYAAGPELVERQIIQPLAQKYEKQYGVDWVNFGFKTGQSQLLIGLARDILSVVGAQDIHGNQLAELPLIQWIMAHDGDPDDPLSVHDISMLVELTGSATLEYWVQFWQGPYGTPITFGCTGIIVPEAFPFLDAGQIKGLLKGLAGAAEYKFMVQQSVAVADRDRNLYVRMTSQSLVHILVILLIIWGNIEYMRQRKGRLTHAG